MKKQAVVMRMLFVLLAVGFVLLSCDTPIGNDPETYYTVTFNINGGSGGDRHANSLAYHYT